MAATVIFDLVQFSVLSLIPGFSITFLVFHSFFSPAMQWSILFLLPCGLQYYASYVIVFGRFHVSPIHRHDFILSKGLLFPALYTPITAHCMGLQVLAENKKAVLNRMLWGNNQLAHVTAWFCAKL